MKYVATKMLERLDPTAKQIVQIAIGDTVDNLSADEVKYYKAQAAIEPYVDPTKAAAAKEDAEVASGKGSRAT